MRLSDECATGDHEACQGGEGFQCQCTECDYVYSGAHSANVPPLLTSFSEIFRKGFSAYVVGPIVDGRLRIVDRNGERWIDPDTTEPVDSSKEGGGS
jgi:hypothetical protein